MVRNLRKAFGGKWLFAAVVFFFIFSLTCVFEKEASAAKNYSIIVKIKGAGVIKSGVEVNVEGNSLDKTLTTKKNGILKFLKLAKGTYTVTPSKEGYSFTPSSKDITFTKRRRVTASFTINKEPATEESVSVSKPKNGTYFVAGEKPAVTITLPEQYSRSDYSQLRFQVYGPQETTKTITAVKLLNNASTDRTATPHHYVDLITDTNVQVNGNILKYPLAAITDEEAGTYTASLWVVLKDDSTHQSFPLVDFQIGTATVETQIVEREKCAVCHLGASSGQYYFHHVDPSGSNSYGNPSLDSWAVRTCKSCHNNEGYAAYRDPNDTNVRIPDPIVKRVHGIHMGENLENPLDNDPLTGIFRDYIDLVFPYGVRGETTAPYEEISGVRNCTVCHVDDRWKTTPSRLACGACHDNIWFGDPASLPEGGELHPGGQQNNDNACSGCHPPDTGGLEPVAVAHKVDSHPLNSIDISMTAPVNGSYYSSADDANGVSVSVTIRDDNGTAIDHTAIDTLMSTANLYVYGPRMDSKPVLTNAALDLNSKASASVTNAIAGPWAGLNGKVLKMAVDGGTPFNVTITGSEPVTPEEVVAALTTAFTSNSANAKASVSSATKVKIESLTKGDNSQIAIYNSDVTTIMDWKGATTANNTGGIGVTMEPFVKEAAVSTMSNNLRSTSDTAITRSAGNVAYKLPGKFADLTPGTYCVLVYSNPSSSNATFTNASSLGFMTFQVGTETEEKKVATNCTDCHGDSVMHLYESHVHPAQFDPDYCKACHDYGHYNKGEGFVNQGGTSTNGWSGFGAVPIVRRVHGVHRGKYLDKSYEIYANADYFKDVIFPQDIRNCTKCHSSDTTGTWKTEPSRLACLSCHDSDVEKSHDKLMTYDPTPEDPYGGDEVETCIVCHGPDADFAVEKVHNISNPYKAPYPREPEE